MAAKSFAFRDEDVQEEYVESMKGRPIEFQLTDWYQADFEDDVGGDSDDDRQNDRDDSGGPTCTRSYMVKMFGVTAEGYSVCVNASDFEPFFYVRVGNMSNVRSLLRTVNQRIEKAMPRRFVSDFNVEVVTRKNMYGFSNDTPFEFFRISFNSLTCMYIGRKALMRNPVMCGMEVQFFESNIVPFLKLIHERNIKPCAWVAVTRYDTVDTSDPLMTKCQINLRTDYKHVSPVERNGAAPVVIMSFDIECTSHTGDFPVPRKTYRKTAEEIYEMYTKTIAAGFSRSDTWWSTFKETLARGMVDIYRTDTSALNLLVDNRTVDFKPMAKVRPKRKLDIDTIKSRVKREVDEIFQIMHDPPNFANGFEERYNLPPTPVNMLEKKLNGMLPPLKGDEVIQIGSTIHRYGDNACCYKSVITLDTCDPLPGIDVTVCKTEKELIKKWCALVNRIDPDIITGYNIFGFDFTYVYERAQELGCDETVLRCGRLLDHTSAFQVKTLSSSALGDNELKYVEMEGRVLIDLMKVVQREHKLDTYKLDNVAAHFIGGKVKRALPETRQLDLDTTTGLNEGGYVKLDQTHKVLIERIEGNRVTLSTWDGGDGWTPKTWGLAKDDVTPKEIFQCQKGTSTDRAKIAKYCVQDCALCNMLVIKLEVFANNMGMANVCLVPLSYIFMRGQGVKIFSLVAKQCEDDGYLIPVIRSEEDEETEGVGYEGAIVLDPIPGIYVEAPISVMDYASLYPSSMISENISHDSIVLDDKYDNMEGIDYVDITYDIYSGAGDKKVKTGEQVCRFAQFPDNKKGILPRILMKLLSQRKLTRKKIQHETITTRDGQTHSGMVSDDAEGGVVVATAEGKVTVPAEDIMKREDTYNDFMKAVLDGLQLAYKITANSLYGQVGARTSPIYMKELAASTTATGRNLILKAKAFMEEHYDADVVYGDTDSIFVDFKIKEKFGITDKKACIQKSIDVAVEASDQFKKVLKAPHDLEYEKTFYPFIILSKKKYVGNLYEFDVNKFKQKSMGIVLKRRDNANIVKLVYGGIIDILLNEQNIPKAVDFLRRSLDDLAGGKYDINDLVITKTLRGSYKDPSKIAHKVLADRMFDRDPGSAPQVNDRIPYVYIEHDTKNKSLLQGDKIEHPGYITENRIKIDYIFYITNQLMKPICQLLSVALFDIDKCSKTPEFYARTYKQLCMDFEGNEKRAKDKIAAMKQTEVQKLLFDDCITMLNHKRTGQTTITRFFNIA